MDVTIRELGGCTVARVAGRLDAASAADFDRDVDGCLSRGTRKLVLDFSALDYISSAGLRSVLGAMKRLRSAGGEVVVAGIAGMVKEVFAVSGVDTLLSVKATADEAAAGL